MIRALIVVALAGCIHDYYDCTTDADCNLGAAGRCERDHHCTQFDLTCATERRYTQHSEADTNTCWDGRLTPANVCAAGQSPALPVGCAAMVCDALPACCATGWSSACVLEAQQVCEVTCDTRIAITATKGLKTELWDLQYDGTTWSATARTDRETLLAYLAPAPGGVAPRIAGFSGPGALVVEDDPEIDVALGATNDYHDMSSVDFDRDERDTVALAWQDPTTSDQYTEIVKLATGTAREIVTGAATRESWGDYDHDGFPDGVSATGTRYVYLASIDDPSHQRSLDGSVSTSFGGLATPSAPGTRSFDWVDLNGDHDLDLVAFGNSLRVHLGGDRITDVALVNIDCDPPATVTSTCDTTLASFAGAALPASGGPTIIAATSPNRGIYRVTVHVGPPASADILPLELDPLDPLGAPILAVVVWDLDGDHKLDVVAIDANLDLYVALTSVDPSLSHFVETTPITPVNTGFTAVRTSVAGAPR